MKKEQRTKCPFIGPDGRVKSPFRAILDRCILWPTPPPERIGKGIIELPQSVRKDFQDSTAILLSVGPGYYDNQGKWHPTSDQLKPGVRVSFDKTVPWCVIGKDQTGKEHVLVICGVMDIQGILV